MDKYVSVKETAKEVRDMLDKQENALKYQYQELRKKRNNFASNLISYPMNEEDRWHTTNGYACTINRMNLILESLEKIKDIRYNMMMLDSDLVSGNYHGKNEDEL